MHGPGRLISLDWGQELWKWDVTLYESGDGIKASLNRSGRPLDEDSILFHATHSLLADVVDAAGGLEGSIMRLHTAMDRAQKQYIEWSATTGELPDGGGMMDSTTEDAWYALEESLVWARTLDDRLRRPPVDRRRYPDQGLIPALADGLRREAVIAARARLLTTGANEARYLSGLNLHMQSIQAGSKGGPVRSGRVLLPFPDKVDGSISHRWQLTFNDDRDALSFADHLMESVELFMDEMLEAFEQHVPERFRSAES
jgi:hypothetical protein